MVYDLQEQEQLAEFKAWWEKYGNFILAAVTLVLVAFAAYNGWNWYRREQSGQAARIYEEVQKAIDAHDNTKAKDLGGKLLESYGGTVYGPLTALQMAKLDVDGGDSAKAKEQLKWVMEKSGNQDLMLIARLRLAGLLLDDKQYDDALKLVTIDTPKSQATAFADRRGDILQAQGKTEEARAAYKLALEQADAQHPLRGLIQLKLDALPSSAS